MWSSGDQLEEGEKERDLFFYRKIRYTFTGN